MTQLFASKSMLARKWKTDTGYPRQVIDSTRPPPGLEKRVATSVNKPFAGPEKKVFLNRVLVISFMNSDRGIGFFQDMELRSCVSLPKKAAVSSWLRVGKIIFNRRLDT